MSEFDITEQLLRYLDGEMSQEERAAWELRLNADADLKDQLDHLQLAREAVQLVGSSLKVKHIHEAFVQQNPVSVQPKAMVTPMYNRRWMRVAVAVTIFVMLSAGWWLNQTTNNAIYDNHFVTFSVSNSRNQGGLSAIEEAYNTQQYGKVLQLAAGAPLQGTDSLLAGIAMIKTEQFDQAVQWLSAMQSSHTFGEDASYYLAFAWIGKKEDRKALQILEAIHRNERHLYHGAVNNDLLRKIKYRP